MADVVETQMYWIQSSDGGVIVMDGQRLGRLLDKMPALRFLLLGHPNMQPKTLEEANGAKVLVIDKALEVSKYHFIDLIQVFFELDPLPSPNTEEWHALLNTLTKLGGCCDLEHRIHQIQIAKDAAEQFASRVGPLTPTQDINGEYNWHLLACRKGERQVTPNDFANRGFGFAQLELINDQEIYHFRQKKQT